MWKHGITFGSLKRPPQKGQLDGRLDAMHEIDQDVAAGLEASVLTGDNTIQQSRSVSVSLFTCYFNVTRDQSYRELAELRMQIHNK